MKILFKSLLMIVAAGGGLALGFALRGKTVSHTGGSPAAKATPATVSEVRPSRASNPPAPVLSNDDSPLATKLERDLSMSSGVTRWLYWLEALEKAVPGDFPRLLRIARGNAAATRLVSERWIELYPRHVFDAIFGSWEKGDVLGARDLAYQLFEQWPG